MSDTRFSVVFCGTPDFAVPSLQALIADDRFTVLGVVTQPDKPVGRTQELTPPPVKVAAQAAGLEVWQPEDINTGLTDSGSGSNENSNTLRTRMTNPNFDYLVVVAYGQILKKQLLDAPAIAPVNVHASLLPRWRGASPMQAAILAGDKETGVTIQRMSEGLDEGDILNQTSIPLTEDINISALHDDLAQLGATLLTETLSKPLSPTPQDEEQVTHCKKMKRSSGDVDPNTMTAEYILRAIRAYVPWPGVRTTILGHEVKLLEAGNTEQEGSFALDCAEDSTLHITKMQSPGKKAMSGAEWLRGHQ